MKNSKEIRTCIGCRKKDNKHNLIRMILNNNQIILDPNQKLQGKGIYLCKNEECLDKILKNKSLKLNFDKDYLEKIRGVIFGG